MCLLGQDMLTDACASCTPYAGGYAHWGMLEAATWFAEHELKNVKGFLDKHPGYELLLVGHSLGAGALVPGLVLLPNRQPGRLHHSRTSLDCGVVMHIR